MRYINFHYCYRDAGNNKNHGTVSFINTGEIGLSDLEKLIRSKLIDEVWFVAEEWGLPNLHFECWDRDLDHDWHEFVGVKFNNEKCNIFFDFNFFDLLKSMRLL
jgi:hypothetical protein